MSALFCLILSARAGNKIDGEFVEYSIEERLSKLEQDLAVTNTLVREMAEWFNR